MHMADALLSPAVGCTMWAASAAALAWATRRLKAQADEGRLKTQADEGLVPLMGVLGAFILALQMLNFAIPATGSSGHLGGGLLLAILVGPAAALVVMASVLGIQALIFADGGLLAWGANLFNLGVLPCLLAYPLLYRPLAGAAPSARRAGIAALVAAVVGLQLGAAGVVAETALSGVAGLPWQTFAWLMQPIHLAIGIAEGLATAALLAFLRANAPELLRRTDPGAEWRRPLMRRAALAALVAGGVLSWFASPLPDGLEWSLARAGAATAAPAPSPATAP
ncbi:putative fused nickel transport protein NikMN [Rubrivivax sp. A210]|uniref:energy-coupling factor ABC transporter permease n=1 Tax=Rubrivivax sp. A210 TaxID=2772301 RepID=UPI00191B2135|nr:energy-coupling factor ABC transporter permease [Rubrivivax sp. A210]CAD5375008.1 putative fused nickel transport protein NikMN [Rubrivivax sp. A210]